MCAGVASHVRPVAKQRILSFANQRVHTFVGTVGRVLDPEKHQPGSRGCVHHCTPSSIGETYHVLAVCTTCSGVQPCALGQIVLCCAMVDMLGWPYRMSHFKRPWMRPPCVCVCVCMCACSKALIGVEHGLCCLTVQRPGVEPRPGYHPHTGVGATDRVPGEETTRTETPP